MAKVIVKAEKVKLTAGRIADFQCPKDSRPAPPQCVGILKPCHCQWALVEPRIAHDKACAVAGVNVTLHGLRRSFASLREWIEMPAGIAAQIQRHTPQGVREQQYFRRPLDLLRMWHVKIEEWMLSQAGIEFVPVAAGLRVVPATRLNK